jgi:hypothetical protein
MAAIAAPDMKAQCKPFRNSCISWGVKEPGCVEAVTGAKLYSTAPEIAMPRTIPTLRIAAIIPEAIPRCHGGTLPMISELLGL